MQSHPDALGPRVSLASYYLRVGQPESAVAMLSEIKEQYPNDPSLLAHLGKAQVSSGELESALATFRELIVARPDWAHAHYLAATVHLRLNDSRDARFELETAIRLNPNHIPAKIELTRMHMQANDLEEAKKLLAELEQTEANHPGVLSLRASLAMSEERWQEAVEFSAKAAHALPDSKLTLQLAIAQWRAGDREGTVKTLESWLEAHPDDVPLQVHLANTYLLLDRPQEARAAFAKVIQSSPDHALALNNLAWLLREENPGRAVGLAERALKLTPEDPRVMETLAVTLLNDGQTARALALLRDASERAPNNLETRYHLAVALNRSGKEAEAVDLLKNILAMQQPFESKQEAQSLLQALEQ